MKTALKPFLLAALLGSASLAVYAQPASAEPTPPKDRREAMREPRQEHMAKRMEELKAQLKLSPQQEGSWTSYIAAIQPTRPAPPAKPEDWSKLSTPERLDKMREMRKAHEAAFDQRDTATRTFYGSLNPDQKKIFDNATARMGQEGPHRPGPGPR